MLSSAGYICIEFSDLLNNNRVISAFYSSTVLEDTRNPDQVCLQYAVHNLAHLMHFAKVHFAKVHTHTHTHTHT